MSATRAAGGRSASGELDCQINWPTILICLPGSKHGKPTLRGHCAPHRQTQMPPFDQRSQPMSRMGDRDYGRRLIRSVSEKLLHAASIRTIRRGGKNFLRQILARPSQDHLLSRLAERRFKKVDLLSKTVLCMTDRLGSGIDAAYKSAPAGA